MTSPQGWPKPDLLQQRRLELGLPFQAEVHLSQRHLLFKGALLGLVLALSPIALLFALETFQLRLDGEVLELAQVEARVGNAHARLQTMDKKRGALNQQTKLIVAQLVSLRSGSALLEQMRQVTPQGVRLLSLVALPSKLIIKGEAEGADALARINALALNLEAQNELLTHRTSIAKAKANEKGRIDFSLESVIDSADRASPERLRELGSEGLARRYELLREQGFGL